MSLASGSSNSAWASASGSLSGMESDTASAYSASSVDPHHSASGRESRGKSKAEKEERRRKRKERKEAALLQAGVGVGVRDGGDEVKGARAGPGEAQDQARSTSHLRDLNVQSAGINGDVPTPTDTQQGQATSAFRVIYASFTLAIPPSLLHDPLTALLEIWDSFLIR